MRAVLNNESIRELLDDGSVYTLDELVFDECEGPRSIEAARQNWASMSASDGLHQQDVLDYLDAVGSPHVCLRAVWALRNSSLRATRDTSMYGAAAHV